ncbi:MAG TPA: MBG domain-containing protein [Puia sp.]|uniref:MBG domain-containing protein n=1 Tax=Puia sp. TaxID=2045100 RepID=UPI002B95EAEC|nr:MBG domain-containing protein [Puia sp.]HVU96515.1 MBG domain-containing protein [Puia sp.]
MREKKFILTGIILFALGSPLLSLAPVGETGPLLLAAEARAGAPKDLNISPSTVPNGQYGTSYKQMLKATGGVGTITFSITRGNLPPGLSLSADGELSGVPTGAGSFSFTVTAVTSVLINTASGSRDYTLNIKTASLDITANNAIVTYGGAVPTLTASYSGFVNGDNPSSLSTQPAITTTGSSSSPTGEYPITASGAASPNYDIHYHNGTLTINPAVLNVAANAQTKSFGAPDPPLTYAASGFVNGDNTGVFSGALSRSPGENVGTYPINRGNLGAGGNYTISYTSNYLTITRDASQHISWTQSLLVGCNSSTQLTLTATASSGLPVAYSVSDPTIATVSGNILTLLSPGTAVITATQAGNVNYTAAAPVNDTLVYASSSLIRQHWDDAIFFDNSDGEYVKWQWYKNGQAVTGATASFYTENPLNGQYYVVATNRAGEEIQSCTLAVKPGAAASGGIKVSPNPIPAGAPVTVTSNYSGTALQGATLQIIDLQGKVRQKLTSVQPSMTVTMPSESGIYIVQLQLGNGQQATINVLVQG